MRPVRGEICLIATLPATSRHITFTIGHCCPPIHGFYYYYWPLLPAISRHLTLHAARHFTAIYFYCWFLVGVFAIIFVYSSQVLRRNKDEQKRQKYATAPTHELAAAAEPAKPNLPGQSQFHVRLNSMGSYIHGLFIG